MASEHPASSTASENQIGNRFVNSDSSFRMCGDHTRTVVVVGVVVCAGRPAKPTIHCQPTRGGRMDESSLKNRTWEILERPAAGDRASRLFDAVMIVLILASVAGVIVRTVPSAVEQYGAALQLLEYFSVAVFTLEILLRLWVADLVYPTRQRPP